MNDSKRKAIITQKGYKNNNPKQEIKEKNTHKLKNKDNFQRLLGVN